MAGKKGDVLKGGEGSFSGEMVIEVESTAASPSMTSESGSTMAAAVEDARRRHEAWGAQFTSVGQKESELFSTQWKLIRDELGTLTQDLAAVKFGLEELRASSQHAMARMKMTFAEKEDTAKQESDQRLALETSLREELKKLRTDLQAESQMREDGDKLALSLAADKADQAATELQALKSRDLKQMKESLNSMKGRLGNTGSQLEGLKDSITMETRGREIAYDSLLKTLHGHRDAMSKDVRKVQLELQPHKQEVQNLRDALEAERTVRDGALAPIHERLGGIEKSLQPQKLQAHLELPALRAASDNHKARHDEAFEKLKKMNESLAAVQARVDNQLAEFAAKAEQESAARRALEGELGESIATINAQVKHLKTVQAEGPRQHLEALDKVVQEATTRMSTLHQEVQEKMSTHKQDLSTRLGALERGHKELEQKAREVPAPATQERALAQDRAPDHNLAKKTDDLAKQVRELHSRVPPRGMVSETIVYPHEDYIAHLQDSLQDFCERFLGGLQRRRSTLNTRALLVHGEVAMMESSMQCAASTESGAEAMMEPQAESGAFVEQEPMQAESGIGTQEAAEIITEPDGMGTQEACEMITEPEISQKSVAVPAPELTAEEQKELQQVLDGQRIELVMNTGGDSQQPKDFAASLKLNVQINFKPVHHGDEPVAEYKEEDKVMQILGDVATIMKIYCKATLLVEGHTATPPGKMDQWAHDLAFNRATKVKNTIASLGTDPERLKSVGLPGNLGNGKVDTVLKIVSF